MAEEIYRCESCNGILQYDVESKQMKCANCGNVVPIYNDADSIVEHTLTLSAKQSLKPAEKTTSTMECQGCGAHLEIGKDDTTTECPYCGSAYVLADKQLDSIIPDGLIPFYIDMNRAKEVFHTWVKKRWLAPGKLKTLYQNDKMQSLYLPYWTFDADADADYTGMGGKNRTETYRDKEGHVHTKTVTDWYHTHGHIREKFDDCLVKAVQNERAAYVESVEPFDTKRLVSFDPHYLSGCVSQCFDVDLETAHKTARSDMDRALKNKAREQIKRKYDEAKDIRIRPVYQNESYKHILVPVYATSYHYEGKLYQVAINGQTGSVSGSYPKSPFKIAALILAGILLLLAILYGYTSDDSSTYYGYGNASQETTYEAAAADDFQEITQQL